MSDAVGQIARVLWNMEGGAVGLSWDDCGPIAQQKCRLAAQAVLSSEPVRGLVEAGRNLAETLDGGFVQCERCGSQETTGDMDFVPEFIAALSPFKREGENK